MLNPSTALEPESASQVDFESIKLHPGAQLQIQHLTRVAEKYNLRLIGAIKGKSVLLTMPFVDGQAVRMLKGQSYVIRGFNGKYAYAFTSHVIQARAHPFHYIHFSYPLSVEAKVVRKSLRVNVNLPASAMGKSAEIPVTMIDLSAKGSMIDAPQAIGGIGDVVSLEFDVSCEEIKSTLVLSAKIRNATYSKDATRIHIGVEFENIPQNDMLILNNFILAASVNV